MSGWFDSGFKPLVVVGGGLIGVLKPLVVVGNGLFSNALLCFFWQMTVGIGAILENNIGNQLANQNYYVMKSQ